jgi:hypothetical protein
MVYTYEVLTNVPGFEHPKRIKVTLAIDHQLIVKMLAGKAAQHRSGVATALGGAIKVRRVE